MYENWGMWALGKFKAFDAKDCRTWVKHSVFLAAGNRGLVAMRCDGAQMWATTVPWVGRVPGDAVSMSGVCKDWLEACRGSDPVRAEFDGNRFRVGGVALRHIPYCDAPEPNRVLSLLRAKTRYSDGTETLDYVRNANIPKNGGIALPHTTKDKHWYNAVAIIRWFTHVPALTPLLIGYDARGILHLKTADETFELALMRRA